MPAVSTDLLTYRSQLLPAEQQSSPTAPWHCDLKPELCFHPWRCSRPAWMGPWAAWAGINVEVGGPVCGGGLALHDPWGPFHPKPSYGSLIPISHPCSPRSPAFSCRQHGAAASLWLAGTKQRAPFSSRHSPHLWTQRLICSLTIVVNAGLRFVFCCALEGAETGRGAQPCVVYGNQSFQNW